MKSKKRLLKSLGSFLLLSLSGCVTIRDTKFGSVAGRLTEGCDFYHTLTDEYEHLSFSECIEALEPQPERPDPKKPGKTLPQRAGAIIMPAEDYNRQHEDIEEACHELGGRCDFEVKKALENSTKGMKALATPGKKK